MAEPKDDGDKTKGEKLFNGLNLDVVSTKLKEIFNTWTNIGDYVDEIDKEAFNVVKTFGVGAENVRAIKNNLVLSRDELISLGLKQSDITNIITESASALGRNTILTKDVIVSIGQTMAATGVSTRELATSFKDTGYSLSKIGEEMTKVMNTAAGLGVNTKAVSSEVVRNMDKMNLFTFQGGVEGMARMASQASMLRIDMGRTLTIAENLFSPEKAIDMAASLQRLGVTQSSLLDPLKLMDLAQNDPAELQNQIVEMTKSFSTFNEETGKFEIAPGGRRQLKEIAESLGMSYQELTKMSLGSAELEDKLSKIHVPEKFVNEEQKKMIANLAEMNKEGKYEITFFDDRLNKTVTKMVDELGEGDAEMIEKMGDPKDMATLAKNQLSVSEDMAASLKVIEGRPGYAAAISQPGEDLLQMSRQVVDSAAKISTSVIDYKKTAEFGDEVFKDMYQAGKQVVSVLTGDGSIFDVFDKLSSAGSTTVKFLDDTFINTIKTTNTEFQKLKVNLENFDKKYGGAQAGETTTIKPPQKDVFISKDNVIQPIDDNDNILAFKKLTGMDKESKTAKGSHSTLEVIHRVSFVDKLPPHINENNLVAYLEKIMNNLSFQDGLSKSLKQIASNYGLTESKIG